jgi:UDPglucose 6-dehydrogenase
MKIAIMDTGYVGLVPGVYLADFGNNIICANNDKEKN